MDQSEHRTPSAGLAEIVLVVRNVRASAEFYREAVGLTPRREADDRWAWFWAGDPGAPMSLGLTTGPLLFEEHSPRPAGDRFGPVHYAFTVPADRLAAALERLRAHGVEVHGPTRLEWMSATSHYFYDPDGNLAEFWTPDAG